MYEDSHLEMDYEDRHGQVDDEQGDRIREALADYMANPDEYGYDDLEELFEDRDPAEFL